MVTTKRAAPGQRVDEERPATIQEIAVSSASSVSRCATCVPPTPRLERRMAKWSVIDADIHIAVDQQRLLDFLPEPHRRRFASGNRGPGPLGYWNPNGINRSDAITPAGGRIETSPTALAKYFLDVYG